MSRMAASLARLAAALLIAPALGGAAVRAATGAPVAPGGAVPGPTGSPAASAVAPAAVPAPAAAALPFIADDWPRALAEAKRRRVPIFVEAWAPW